MVLTNNIQYISQIGDIQNGRVGTQAFVQLSRWAGAAGWVPDFPNCITHTKVQIARFIDGFFHTG